MTRAAASAAEIPVVEIFESTFAVQNPRLAFVPRPLYVRGVKSILVSIFASVVCSMFAGCATGKNKSSIRTYDGDSSPNIRMYEEKPGYPLNNRR